LVKFPGSTDYGATTDTVVSGWETLEGRLIIVSRQADLLQVVQALCAAGCLTNLLNGWQQKANQNANDGNDDEQFYQGKSLTTCSP
jgi:hypothetical protein